ncbi:MAG TPA: hypothetical protein DCO72_02400 [Ruminococcus sp.]|nr:hypothetical protein [Ruminococcus sp.]
MTEYLREFLSDYQQMIYDTVGKEAYLKLVENFGGQRVFLWKADTLDRALHRADTRNIPLAECLSNKQKAIYDLIGEDAYVELAEKFGGGCIVPCSRHTLHNARWKADICNEFDGMNFNELMRKYHVSKQFLSELLKK